ncbi:hypothetical protein CDD82_6356 [Ophiocordyceps australis]|uniref:Methyltransferase domain-containing protein n=1 Tax=Ophiocordyceps australis TaxID=1399860 RepID=A0A2C5ZR58_9HYPO|nr:hypothetical protein CDD82_6356 [Ophiocordyceps australis]
MSQSSDSPQQQQQTPMVQGYWAHGRYYGSWKQGKYLCPIDSEELNRLDLLHKFFLVARKGALTSVNLDFGRPARIMDMGTGTGIWAIQVSDSQVMSRGEGGVTMTAVLTWHCRLRCIPEIMAIDINLIQPRLIPRGMVTMQFDIEEPSWDALYCNCDLIFFRMLLGSIRTDKWPSVYRNALEHLAPGTGYLEHVEIDWEVGFESSGEIPPNSAFKEWSETYLRGLDGFFRNARVRTQNTKRLLEEAGFCDIREQTIRCYVNPWSADPEECDTARWFNMGINIGLQAMSVAPLVEKLRWTVEEVKQLCERTFGRPGGLRLTRSPEFITHRHWGGRGGHGAFDEASLSVA